MRDTLVELRQSTRRAYRRHRDRGPAPLGPNLAGRGRCLTDAEGGSAS